MNQLRATLTERHVNMMAFSQCVGFGLFLQSGRAIYLAGPALATLAYFIAGTVMWSSAACLGEMTALFPVKGPIYEFPKRFLDQSVGYAAGWMTWFNWVVLLGAELLVITHIFQFRYPPEDLAAAHYPTATLEWMPRVASAVLVMGFLVLILILNLLPVLQLAQIEYIAGVVKLVYIVMMIMLNFVLQAWQPMGKKGAFWTYNRPYSAASQSITLPNGHVLTGFGGRLGAMWEAMTTALFGMIGFETVAITAAENKDLRTEETVKIGTRKISLRVITLFCFATFSVGLNVPSDYPTLQDNSVLGVGYGQNSAFVISAVLNGLQGWPYFINGFIIFSACSAGINALYNASRILHALASDRDAWPEWSLFQVLRSRLERTKYGCPYNAVIASWLFGMLGFLAGQQNSARILGRMVRCLVIASLIVYAVICLSYLEFYKCIQSAAEGSIEDVEDKDDPDTRKLYDRNAKTYPYKSHGQWLRACYAFVGCFLLSFFNGWRTFVRPFSAADFLACYIAVAIFVTITTLYCIKFNGWNPSEWRRRASRDMQNPRPMVVEGYPRRGRLRLENKDNIFTLGNASSLLRWLWVWVK